MIPEGTVAWSGLNSSPYRHVLRVAYDDVRDRAALDYLEALTREAQARKPDVKPTKPTLRQNLDGAGITSVYMGSPSPPVIVDAACQPLDASAIVPGSIVRTVVTLQTWQKQLPSGRLSAGVGIQLLGVQKIGRGQLPASRAWVIRMFEAAPPMVGWRCD